MKVTIYASTCLCVCASVRWHGITDAEIRAVLEHSVVRYRVAPRADPEAQLTRMVGDFDGGPFIEVVAEQVEPGELHAFHAMLLTTKVAREVLQVTGGTVDLADQVSLRQRTQQEES